MRLNFAPTSLQVCLGATGTPTVPGYTDYTCMATPTYCYLLANTMPGTTATPCPKPPPSPPLAPLPQAAVVPTPGLVLALLLSAAGLFLGRH